jgi:hypothetical protein
MHKKLLFVLLFGTGGLSLRAQAQARRIDTVAVSILDRMSAMIGDLNSCSVTVKSNYDIISHQLGLVKHSDEEQLYMHGPNKLLLRSDGDKGSRDFYFNGQTLSYYSLDKNQYGQIEAPVSVMEMIDTVNKLYGIDFPVADFFYPSFVDDILAESGNLVYLGLTKINGKECFHLAGTTKEKTYQFWITNDAFSLPMKVVIVYTGKEMSPQYEAVLSDWQVNPTLPDAMFEFVVPNMARRIKLVPMNTKVNLKK